MSTVIISERYRVQIDPMNHTLETLTEGGKNPKTGKPTDPRWAFEGYFPNMAQCINRVVNLELAKGNETRSLEEYLEQCKRLIEWAKTI